MAADVVFVLRELSLAAQTDDVDDEAAECDKGDILAEQDRVADEPNRKTDPVGRSACHTNLRLH